MTIQFVVLGFEPTNFRTRDSSHNHYTNNIKFHSNSVERILNFDRHILYPTYT